VRLDPVTLYVLAVRAESSEPERSTMAAESEDRELVERAQRGDRDAFAALYMRYRGVVHAVALARLRPDEAGDLVQDAFARALSQLDRLRRPEAFGAWLLMIARNRASDFHRQRRPAGEDPDALPHHDAPRVEALRVLQLIRELPGAYQETLLMRLVAGMTGPEIAARTGLTPESVRVNLHRGMKLLRARLGVEKTP